MKTVIDYYLEGKRLVEEDVARDSSIFMKRASKALDTDVEKVNLVYGEIFVEDFLKLIAAADFKEGETLVDLGCGTGNCLACAALYSSLSLHAGDNTSIGERQQSRSKILGLELLCSKLIECRLLLSHLNALVDTNSLPSLPTIDILETDFIKDSKWKDLADVVYSAATIFSPNQLRALLPHFLKLKEGCRIIILDKEINESNFGSNFLGEGTSLTDLSDISNPNHNPNPNPYPNPNLNDIFELLDSMKCMTTWGLSWAFIYRKR